MFLAFYWPPTDADSAEIKKRLIDPISERCPKYLISLSNVSTAFYWPPTDADSAEMKKRLIDPISEWLQW